ncbi:DUF3267 domain-containing protein [Salinivirga cyanobacteriivorans]
MYDKRENLKQIDLLDFRNNKKQLIISYFLRAIGVIVFGYIFLLITNFLANDSEVVLKELINIEIKSLPAILSIILIILDVVFVIFLHELIHASVVFLTHKQKPNIGIRGLIVYAAAPENVLTKAQFIIMALAPFVAISIIGSVLIFLLQQSFWPWVFIPTVANAAAAAGDFMAVLWALKQPENAKFIDEGDITYAYNSQ